MADYYPLIAKAVNGLEKGTGEARRGVYDRARTALLAQLRAASPSMSEPEIRRERLSLEEAIRKVEAESARKSRNDPPPPTRSEARPAPSPPPPAATAAASPAPAAAERRDETFNAPAPSQPGIPAALSAAAVKPASDVRVPEEQAPAAGQGREQLRPERPRWSPGGAGPSISDKGLKGYRDVVADAETLSEATAQAARNIRAAVNAPLPSPEFEPRAETRPDARTAGRSRPESRTDLRAEPRASTRADSRTDPRIEPRATPSRADQRIEPRNGGRVEPRTESRTAGRGEPPMPPRDETRYPSRDDRRPQSRPARLDRDEPRDDLRDNPRGDIRRESRGEPRAEPRGEPRGEPRAEPRGEPRGDPRGDPRGEPRGEPRAEPRGEPRNDYRTSARGGRDEPEMPRRGERGDPPGRRGEPAAERRLEPRAEPIPPPPKGTRSAARDAERGFREPVEEPVRRDSREMREPPRRQREPEPPPPPPRAAGRRAEPPPPPDDEQDFGPEAFAFDDAKQDDYPSRNPLKGKLPEGKAARKAAARDLSPAAAKQARRWRRVVSLTIMALLVLTAAAVAVWKGSGLIGSLRSTPSFNRTSDGTNPSDSGARPKMNDRIGGGTYLTSGAADGAMVAQKVVFFEEDASDPAGKKFSGTAVWRAERVPPAPGQAPEVMVRADINIPDLKLGLRWSLRRNEDKALPASHTVEIMFNLPPDFNHGAIANIPAVMMKQGENGRNVQLVGQGVKVTPSFFLIGLSSVPDDLKRNVQTLKERSWFDIPVVYTDGRRAIIAVEKGTPGDRAFADAFAAWGQ